MFYILSIFFIIWFVFTIFWQFEYCRKKFRFLRLFNIFNILPIWTFFAPKPGINDTHLLFRDKGLTDNYSDWFEVEVFEKRKFYHFLWNPQKRINKSIVDAVSQLKNLKSICDKEKIEDDIFQDHLKLSKGYIVLLSIVIDYPKLLENSVSRQFMVVESTHLTRKRETNSLLSSPFHEI